MTPARLHSNSPPAAPKNWGQINQNLDDYHSHRMGISSIVRIPDLTDWWFQQEETHLRYANLFNVARDRFSVIPPAVGVESSFPLGRDVISWRQSATTGETLYEKVLVKLFALANHRILAADDPALDVTNTGNNSDIQKVAENSNFHLMPKVHDRLEMWQGRHNLRATQKESRTQNKMITAIGYISDTEEIVKASWSHFQHDGEAAFILSERSPLPTALSAKNHPGGQTQILTDHWIWRIHHHPVESVEDSAPESISDTEDRPYWNGNLHNPNDTEEDCPAGVESDIEQGNGIKDPECPEKRGVSAAPNVPRLIRPTPKSKRQAQKVFVGVNAIDMRRNKGVKKK